MLGGALVAKHHKAYGGKRRADAVKQQIASKFPNPSATPKQETGDKPACSAKSKLGTLLAAGDMAAERGLMEPPTPHSTFPQVPQLLS